MTTACIAYYLAARDFNYCKEIRLSKNEIITEYSSEEA